jgi:hypothetical protein
MFQFGENLNSEFERGWQQRQVQLTEEEQLAANQQRRDAIYKAAYASVEMAVNDNQPIAGSMFWKLAIPVFNQQNPRGEPMCTVEVCTVG